MSASDKNAATVAACYPWVGLILDYTEEIAELVPEDKLEWRLPDPSGKWHFSLAEIIMHSADARIMFARQLSGNESTVGYWSTGPGQDGVWSFRPYGSRQEILDSLKSARAELRPWLEQPVSAAMETTEGTRRLFGKALAGMKEKEQDTAAVELRGPANIVRVLMACIAHESGHRGTLQTLLRVHGINASNRE